MVYNDETARIIDQGLETAYQSLKGAVQRGEHRQGIRQYRAAIEAVIQQHFAGENHEATNEFINSLGYFQATEEAVDRIRNNPRLSGQEKDALLIKATTDARTQIFQGFGMYVPAADEGARTRSETLKEPLAQYRLDELIRRIRP